MAQSSSRKPTELPAEHQKTRPGLESKMRIKPRFEAPQYYGSGKLKDKVAIITGGDSGIGRAVAVAFAKEGANVTISYLKEDIDAQQTKKLVEEIGSKCILVRGDVGDEKVCQKIVDKTLKEMGRIDIVVNNALLPAPCHYP
jgi:trans-2-enoyl-CoA reductase